MLRLFASKKLMFLMFAWPILFCSFLASIYSAKVVKKMPVVICDQDNSQLSRLAARYLGATRSLDIIGHVSSADEIKELLLKGKIEAGIYIPRGWAADMKRNKQVPLIAYANGGNMVIGNMVTSDVKTVAGTISAGVRIKFLEKTGSSVGQAKGTFMPVGTENFRLFNPGGNYMRFLAPGLWGAVFMQVLLCMAVIALVTEKENGTMAEAWATAGNFAMPLLIGKMIPYCLLAFILMEFFEFAMYPLFGIPVKNQFGMALANILFIFAVMSGGMYISSIAPTETDSLKGVLALGAPAFILSGYIWPLSAMPLWISTFASIIPLTHYLKALRPLSEYGAAVSQASSPLLTLF
ncbi:MAG: ABC transporter permease, partial [Elusimicrobiales bacterium]|nr:ABC transporter permease [Elusimicrobiales bacterium]